MNHCTKCQSPFSQCVSFKMEGEIMNIHLLEMLEAQVQLHTMDFKSERSRSVTNVTAHPSLPALAVRPTLWTYLDVNTSKVWGILVLKNSITCHKIETWPYNANPFKCWIKMDVPNADTVT
jgi:hypothetical protein